MQAHTIAASIRSSVFILCSLAISVASAAPVIAHRSSDDLWRDASNRLNLELEANLLPPGKKSPYRSARPGPKFNAIYLWDSAFISQIWRQKDSRVAEDVLRSVFVHQLPDGRVPHAVDFLGVSKFTQPPLLSWAVSRIAKTNGDIAFVNEMLPKLRRYRAWLYRERRHANGLFFWSHPFESGMDNSPRESNRDNSKDLDVAHIDAIDLSCYMVMDAEAIIALDQMVLTQSKDSNEQLHLAEEISSLRESRDELAKLIRENLWDENTGYFYDRDLKRNQFLKFATISSFLPLTAGVADQAQAEKLLAHLENPREFNTPIPFPSVSLSDPTYERDMWRGPVWVNTAYLTLQGMNRYGAHEKAHEMASRLVDGVYRTWENTGKFVEFYDPERFDFSRLSRKRGTGLFKFFSGSHKVGPLLEHLFIKQIFLGPKPVSHFVGWTGLINTIVIEEKLIPPTK
jgi:neutral trehalase